MAKDLRGFLEPAEAIGASQTSRGLSSLAQRRSLSSPGEPRVYRVSRGFVCGLCGRLHGGLEKAFDCLGRCTIKLRLRSPVGPSHQGSGTHFTCTACGRGFVNCDDAETCFERCLLKIKPTLAFEQALRQVQIRYMQRLASHGLRSIERIDPLSEHKKILETENRSSFPKNANSQKVRPQNVQPVSAKVSEETLKSNLHPSTVGQISPKFEDDLVVEGINASPGTRDLGSGQELMPETPSDNVFAVDIPSSGAAVESGSPPVGTFDENTLPNVMSSMYSEEDFSTQEKEDDGANRVDTSVIIAKLDLDGFAPLEKVDPQISQAAVVGSESSSTAERPSLTEYLGTDVLSVLQSAPEGENLELNASQQQLLKDKTLDIDTSLLESAIPEASLTPQVKEIFLRKRGDNRAYRRNNAQYACSVCDREHETKELVEACFYSHPEEGSEEERALREKALKAKEKSVA